MQIWRCCGVFWGFDSRWIFKPEGVDGEEHVGWRGVSVEKAIGIFRYDTYLIIAQKQPNKHFGT